MRQAHRDEPPTLVDLATIVLACMVAAFVVWGSLVILLALT